MGIEFDDAAASRLVDCAAEVAMTLRASAAPRRSNAEAALLDFDGAYARLFEAARLTESTDRIRLAKGLEAMVDQLRIAQRQADEERQRLADLASWRQREADRELVRTAGGVPMQPVLDWSSAVFDPKPSSTPKRPSPVSATFSAQARQRTGGGRSGGRSSADPSRLRQFSATARAQDASTEQDLVRVRNAWTAFTSRCNWVPIDGATLPGGFGDYLAENAEDASSVDRIADAFSAAGGGSLANTALDAAAASTLPSGLQRLLDPCLTPAEVAAAWAALGFTDADVRALPLATQLQFAGLDGVPAAQRDIASRAVLSAAARDPERLYRLMGLAYTYGAVSLDEFREQVIALRDGLRDADDLARGIRKPSTAVAQLVGFGVSNGALVAAVALGDLDTASNVTVNVPGAMTTLDSMGEKVRAANELLFAAGQRGSAEDSFAVVSWLGYRAPGVIEVPRQDRAYAGGANLASFLDGIHDSRGTAPRSVTVLGHSYGSTTAAEALAQNRHRVDSFVTYGSVGFADTTRPEHLNVDRVYATEGANDHTAILGRIGRSDPRDLPDVDTFSAGSARGTKAVTGHDMYPEAGGVGYLSPDATSQRTIAKIIATGKP
ncbi:MULTISPECIES: alpha/beta hydrolase [unclassified Curtobacterium]|uniref:alpha/beta hydrolase n=1 Tax=unclassified Curtobacterium TaxID=257496 RepID=UPI000F463581|nr:MULTISPECIES: alpha/beta hydrolase [unclassified Curtobacterium]ROQ17680.1 alpha/beta hydrolase family protein [Curtobacterium sp. PhB171]ROQ29075.1 alpha/beta hydrolase family protein [Curtobacterium sp. PhB170]ROS45781.1 alpha/beta hydrolase family protein [Curtobacterium sp. PhB131]ROS67917.1 alpha/beta hydrolase family protein [Curtobacterium sp. PhB141]